MKKSFRTLCSLTLSLLLAFSLAAPLFGCSSSKPDETEVTEPALADWQLITDAYTFALPLLLMDASAAVSTNTVEATDSRAPLNQLHHASALVDASFTDVVTPNVDTIYTQASLDLSEDAVVFFKPAADRFLSIEVMDFYTNSVAILGTGGDTQEACTYLLTGPDWQGDVPTDMVQVPVPTNNAGFIVRILVDDSTDMANVAALQADMQMVPLSAYETHGFAYDAPKGHYSEANDIIPVEYVLSLEPEEFFSRANELMLSNAPSADDAAMVARMATIGVGPGLEFDVSALGDDYEENWAAMVAGLHDELVMDSLKFMKLFGAWQFFGEPIAEFGTEYTFRALIALDGLGANPVSVAIYPKAETDDAGDVLDGTKSYLIHFDAGQLPPVDEYGFWSITAYGEDNFLIDNPLNRYSINDRSELTLNEDGSLDILVQAEAPEDEELLSNWLPVSTDNFHLYMRIYLPAASILDGSWTPPTILPL